MAIRTHITLLALSVVRHRAFSSIALYERDTWGFARITAAISTAARCAAHRARRKRTYASGTLAAHVVAPRNLLHVGSPPPLMDAVRSSPLVFKGTFVLMGMSALAPLCVTANSNTLVTSSEYFRDAFAETPALASGFSSGLIAVFNATSVIFGVVAALSGSQGNINLARRSLHALLLLCVAIAMGLVSVIIRPTGSVDKPYLYYFCLLYTSDAADE